MLYSGLGGDGGFSPKPLRSVIFLIAITDEEFRKFSEYIKLNYGIHLKEEKKALLTGRLQSLLLQNDCKTFSEYYDYVTGDQTGTATTDLLNKITTNHTFFMREPEHFFFFRDNVLPYLKEKVKNNDLRIWSAGCSTGEEPYTLAMIIDEFLGKEKSVWDAKLLATDISNRALETAKKGVYENKDLEPLPFNWRMNYFKKYDDSHCVISDQIKREVIFRSFNLMNSNFAFKKKFHVIFCRNVMIYFNNEVKWALIDKFYQATEPGGYLFVGHSESFNREAMKYKFVKPAVYRKE